MEIAPTPWTAGRIAFRCLISLTILGALLVGSAAICIAMGFLAESSQPGDFLWHTGSGVYSAWLIGTALVAGAAAAVWVFRSKAIGRAIWTAFLVALGLPALLVIRYAILPAMGLY